MEKNSHRHPAFLFFPKGWELGVSKRGRGSDSARRGERGGTASRTHSGAHTHEHTRVHSSFRSGPPVRGLSCGMRSDEF